MIGNLISVLKAVDEAAAVSFGQSFWELYGTPILTLLGTLLGATVGAYTTWRTTKTTLVSTRRDTLLQLRREEYFNAIEIVHRMQRALQDMGAALSGREQPGIFASRSQRRAADESDQEAASAIGRLIEASNDLQLEVYRLASIGNTEVRERLESLSEGVISYMHRGFSMQDRRFIGKEYKEAMEAYDYGTQLFLAAIRADLQVDESLPE